MSQSIGQKLAAARDKRRLTIEDVAHESRIPGDILRHLEADDYSSFANLTYAKSFLSMYSRHLSVDVTAFLKEFGPSAGDGIEGHAYLEPSSDLEHADSDPFASFAPQPRRHPILLFLLLIGMILAYPGLYMLGKRSGLKSAVQPGSLTNIAPTPKPIAPKQPAPEKPVAVAPAPTPAPDKSEPVRVTPVIAKPSLVVEADPPTVAVASAFPPADRVVRPAALLENEDPSLSPSTPAPATPQLPASPPSATPETPAPRAETLPDTDPAAPETPVDAPAPETSDPASSPAPEPATEETPEPEEAEETPAGKPKPPVRSFPSEDPPNLAKEKEEPADKERFLPRLNPFRKRGTNN